MESEELHRVAYNATFQHFEIRPGGSENEVAHWSVEFYDKLQNSIGGGKPKMRWYFGKSGKVYLLISFIAMFALGISRDRRRSGMAKLCHHAIHTWELRGTISAN